MTKEFKYLMYLFSCGARGVKADNLNNDIDINRTLLLAQNQSIYHTVIYSLKIMDNTAFNISDEKKNSLFAKLRNDTICEYIKKTKLLKLLHDFERAEIKVVILKGYSISNLYALPESRISGDIDIYVDPKDERKSITLLKQNGFIIYSKDIRSHHRECFHPEMGPLELHTRLYYKLIDNIWFRSNNSRNNIIEKYEKVNSDAGSFYSLGKTDNLIFVALHMIKHFIEGGMNLRQMMDFILFYNMNKNDLDLTRFIGIMDKLNYSYLINMILFIGEKYFGFADLIFNHDYVINEDDIEALLNDLEIGGWLGFTNNINHSKELSEYNCVKFLDKCNNKCIYKLYIFFRKLYGFIRTMFPLQNELSKNFPYVKNNIILLPVAWIHRFFKYGLRYIPFKKSAKNALNSQENIKYNSNNRIELFKKVRII